MHEFMRAGSSPEKVWSIGITSSPLERRAILGEPVHWHQWKLDSLEDARRVLRYFASDTRVQVDTADDPAGGKHHSVYLF